MTRPLRLEYAGALYHVTSRGDHCEAIYRDDDDRAAWLTILGLVCKRFNFIVHAYCQMTNHYHLLVETVDGNLSQGMRQLNGLYTQAFNRRHRLVGHLLQGRYKAILVQRERYLMTLTRYIVLNPVRAGMASTANDWKWSSHRFFLQRDQVPTWLDTEWLLRQFNKDPEVAIEEYKNFVSIGIFADSPWKAIRHQLILGDDEFVTSLQPFVDARVSRDTARMQRRAAVLTLTEYQDATANRGDAMATAYHSTAYTMEQIADHFGVSARTVSRAIRQRER
ncbi:transposase [Massilia sp. CF038]|uniref:transposase n=1 Tax=Massilia sp. CF038 TaxID=1881045 RepID=UPI00091A3FAD|nr:transposase [Massilia sp. CF038]SHH63094.1 REP element-mobilizing transposase RayT [Massilia sp. CF038]